MTTPINLNKFRKAKARAEARQRADENVVKHGRSKAVREAETREAARVRALLDNQKLEPKK